MAASDSGAGFHGWALLCGVPATLGVLIINPPLALLLGIATFVVWKIGSHKQEEAEGAQSAERHERERHERERVETAVRGASAAIERCVALHGWQWTVRNGVLRTLDFREIQCEARWPVKTDPCVYAAVIANAPADIWKALRWARDLRRRGRVPRLSSIPRTELLVTLTFADDSDYDPVDAIARYCVNAMLAQCAQQARARP